MKKISSCMKDYLVAIRDLVDEKRYASISDIAKKLKVSRPSATQVVSKLTRIGLVNHEHYGDVFITDAGREIADSVSFRQNLFKQFLTGILGVPEDVAETEAFSLGHYIGTESTKKLSAFIKFVDPKKNPPVWLKLFHNHLEKVAKNENSSEV